MTSRALGRERAPWRVAVTSMAQYESVALWSPLPSITHMVDERPPLGFAILAILTWHFYGPRHRRSSSFLRRRTL